MNYIKLFHPLRIMRTLLQTTLKKLHCKYASTISDFSDVLDTDKDIRDEVKLLDTTKAYGPDCVQFLIVKEWADPADKSI